MSEPNVKTLIEHINGYGPSARKKKGFSYYHPYPGPLLRRGIVEEYVKRKGRGSKGSGESVVSVEEHDSEIDGKTGSEESTHSDA